MAITYKEMHDTFNALEKTMNYLENCWANIEAFFGNKNSFIFVGCGSSYSNAKSFAMICNMSTGKPAIALAAGDVLLHAERYKKCINESAVVFISRSGRTSELIMALDELRNIGCEITVASFVCADETPLGEKSDLVLATPWAFDESVCQTRCVTNAYFMAAYIAGKLTGNKQLLNELQLIIKDRPEYISKTETLAKGLAKLPWIHAVVLADAELEGVAEEGALVFKEVCQLASSYHHVLDVRHGPMVLIGEETLVIVALGTTNSIELNILNDLKEKKATVVAFSDIPIDNDKVYQICFGKPLTQIAKGIPFILLCQMIAYYKSKETGADPDKPTGLDPWISI